MFSVADRKFKCNFSHTVIISSFSLKGQNATISRTSKPLGLGCLRTITFPKMAYPDNPEVVSSYSFQIYVCKQRAQNKTGAIYFSLDIYGTITCISCSLQKDHRCLYFIDVFALTLTINDDSPLEQVKSRSLRTHQGTNGHFSLCSRCCGQLPIKL